jgi:hypothetical protein
MPLPTLTKGLISLLVMLLIGWGGWATTSTLDHSTRIVRAETHLERVPVIKLDLLLQERGIHNPSPSPPQNGIPPFGAITPNPN